MSDETMTAHASTTQTRPPLLIMGSPRSGTTFLSQMVNRFFDIHVCRDNGTMLRFHKNLRHYLPLERDDNLKRLISHLYADHYFRTRLRDRGLTLSEEALMAAVRARTYGGLVDAIFSSVAASHDKSSWGYKRASFATEAHRIDDLFPEARFVHIIRDARDVALSMRAAKDSLLERTWHFAAVDWTEHIRAGQELGRRMGHERYLEVRYETFMAQPAETLVEVLHFSSGVTSDTEVRAQRIRKEIGVLVKPHNTEKWRKALPSSGVTQIERVAGATLSQLGYPVLNPNSVGQPIGLLERLWLQANRVFHNLVRTQTGAILRYRFEQAKGACRARLGGR